MLTMAIGALSSRAAKAVIGEDRRQRLEGRHAVVRQHELAGEVGAFGLDGVQIAHALQGRMSATAGVGVELKSPSASTGQNRCLWGSQY